MSGGQSAAVTRMNGVQVNATCTSGQVYTVSGGQSMTRTNSVQVNATCTSGQVQCRVDSQ